jgi:hypothetical protein
MEQITAFFKDLLLRLKSKSPKFFNILKIIFTGIVAVLGLLIYLNTVYSFGWDKVILVGTMSVTNLLTDLIFVFGGMFTVTFIAISDKSENRKRLKLKE